MRVSLPHWTAPGWVDGELTSPTASSLPLPLSTTAEGTGGGPISTSSASGGDDGSRSIKGDPGSGVGGLGQDGRLMVFGRNPGGGRELGHTRPPPSLDGRNLTGFAHTRILHPFCNPLLSPFPFTSLDLEFQIFSPETWVIRSIGETLLGASSRRQSPTTPSLVNHSIAMPKVTKEPTEGTRKSSRTTSAPASSSSAAASKPVSRGLVDCVD